jgi:hypothetical protein
MHRNEARSERGGTAHEQRRHYVSHETRSRSKTLFEIAPRQLRLEATGEFGRLPLAQAVQKFIVH